MAVGVGNRVAEKNTLHGRKKREETFNKAIIASC